MRRSSSRRAISLWAKRSDANSASGGPRQSESASLKPAVLHQALEAREVELILVDAQQVAGRLRLQAVLAERLAQLRDVDLERLLRCLRRLFLPERVDQAGGGNDLVGVQEKHRQQRPVLGACQVHHSLSLDHIERTEDPELHRPPDCSTGFQAAQAAT